MKPVSVFLLAFLAMGIGIAAAAADEGIVEVLEDLDDFNNNENILENEPEAVMKAEAARLEAEEARVEANNKAFAEGQAATSEGLNKFSDMDNKEFQEDHTGLNVTAEGEFRMMGLELDPESVQNDPEARAIVEEFYKKFDEERASIPKNWNSCTDYDKKWCTKVKNQGNCGSCAAFAAMGMIEIAMAKAGAKPKGLDLAEQYLVDCAYTGKPGEASGCHGAGIVYYPKWFATTAGGTSPHEGVYPYLDNQPFLHCKEHGSKYNKYWNARKWNSGAKVVRPIYDYRCDQTNGRYDDSKLKKMIMKYGAVMTGIHADDRAFKSAYKTRGWKTGGVFDQCTSTKLDHGVVVVGWGDEWGYSSRYKRNMNKKYWLIKNSWGEGWGDAGYLKVERGTCGLGSVCVTVEARKVSGRDPAPNVAPTDNTEPEMYCDMTKVFKAVWPDRSTTKDYTMRYWTGTRTMVSKVKCRKSVCEPAQAGPTNGCMYICGKKQCNDVYKGFHHNGNKPPATDPVNPRPRPRPDNGSSQKWCDLSRIARRNGRWYHGEIVLTVRVSRWRKEKKYLVCNYNKCKARYSWYAPNGACMYICGKTSC